MVFHNSPGMANGNSSFQKRFPTHEKADRALFMSAQCHMKEAERLMDDYRKAGSKGGSPVALVNEEYLAAVEARGELVEPLREPCHRIGQ